MASSFSANWGSLLTLKVRDRWGFRPVLMPDPAHALLAKPRGFGHNARAPVGSVAGLLLRRFPGSHPWILAGEIVEGLPVRGASLSSAPKPPSRKPVPPARCLLRHDSQFGRNLPILHTPAAASKQSGLARRSAQKHSGHAHETPACLAARHSGPRVAPHA